VTVYSRNSANYLGRLREFGIEPEDYFLLGTAIYPHTSKVRNFHSKIHPTYTGKSSKHWRGNRKYRQVITK